MAGGPTVTGVSCRWPTEQAVGRAAELGMVSTVVTAQTSHALRSAASRGAVVHQVASALQPNASVRQGIGYPCNPL